MSDQPRLPRSLTPLSDLLEQAARARRLAEVFVHDPIAPRLHQFAKELETESDRLFRLIQSL